MTVNLSANEVEIHDNHYEKWRATLLDTGLDTMIGGRVKRIQPYTGNESLTYGDGVGNINAAETIAFYKRKEPLITVTSYQPQGKFDVLITHYQRGTNEYLQTYRFLETNGHAKGQQ